MLKVNGARLHTHVGRAWGGNAVVGIYGLGLSALMSNSFRGTGVRINFSAGQHAVSGVTNKSSRPEGARHPVAYVWPVKPGGLASHNESEGVGSAVLSLADGRNISGASAGLATADATLQLIISMLGSSAGTSTAEGNIQAALLMAGSAAGTSTAEALINAIAWCYGVSNGASTASLVSYAKGELKGSIFVNESQATVNQLVAGVWDALVNDYELPGSMGEAMGAAGTAGDPWTTELPGGYSGIQAGAIVGNKLLTVAKFLGLK